MPGDAAVGGFGELVDLDCQQVVELVTEFLEGALDAETADRVEQHLSECEGCDAYVHQIRRTATALGQVPVGSLSDEACSRLLDAFRDFHRRR